jgi:uncharacterized repeat protein (TIGR01451 family)
MQTGTHGGLAGGSLRTALLTLTLTSAGLVFAASETAAAPPALDPIAVETIAEVASKHAEGGRETSKLVPADRVVPGDEVFYTLVVRNTGAAAVALPTVTKAVPEHTVYIGDSAVGPGAEVSYSVDGGRTFDRAENLVVRGADGQPRPAVAADFTHIRWQLKNSLKSNSVAFVRFRAVVK